VSKSQIFFFDTDDIWEELTDDLDILGYGEEYVIIAIHVFHNISHRDLDSPEIIDILHKYHYHKDDIIALICEYDKNESNSISFPSRVVLYTFFY
jgi:hypothetical protein